MEWDLDQGDGLSELFESSQGVGPAADATRAYLETRPELTFGETIVWQGFSDLDSMRPPAMAGRTSIPWNAIVQYASYHGMTQSESDAFLFQLMTLDRLFVSRKNKEAARADK